MDEIELENLIEAYADTIRAVCRKYFLVGGNEDDLFQEGMIGLLEACRDFDKTKGDYTSIAFKKFANVCIKRQIYDAIKKANTKKNQALNNYVSFFQKNNNDEEFEIELNDNCFVDDPEQSLVNKETKDEQLIELTNQLSDIENKVLKLYLEGLTQKKIAKNLNKNVKQIDNTIQRIKRKAQNINNKS